jgi:hypothetical protein
VDRGHTAESVISLATPEERKALGIAECAGIETVAFVAREGGEIVGHLALSAGLGQVFGHDTKYWGKDRAGAAKLWIAAREVIRRAGGKVVVHVVPGDPMREFWIKRGFVSVCEVLRGEP